MSGELEATVTNVYRVSGPFHGDRIRVLNAFSNFLWALSFTLLPVLAGCGKEEGRAPVVPPPAPNTKYFQDSRLSVEMKADGVTWVIGFNDENGDPVTRDAAAGAAQILYNQGGITVSLVADEHVQLVTPFQDSQGSPAATRIRFRPLSTRL